ncbi:WD40-repeat-containing domain protein [Butyriboletus roseoflavus]|nr:WD40-repeat-containing domain protein [Butyriboletus roseoflavus]
MLSTKTDPTVVLDTGRSVVKAVAFHPDGKHVFGGGDDGIRRWRLKDGQEVGKMAMKLKAISVSMDHLWMVCGTEEGASVWDAEMREKVIDVEGTNTVMTVDVSSDSTTFATGTSKAVSIWSITSGERLVGPLKHWHDSYATAVRFSPNGERIAAASNGRRLIRIFDSRNGDELVTINTLTAVTWPSTPLAWSNDGHKIFAALDDNKIKSFDVSTGSQLAESQTLHGSSVDFIALAANGKFIATFASRIISFLDTSTLSWIDPVIKDSGMTWAIAISPDNGYLATGLYNGKISIRDLGSILPDSYGPFHKSDHEGGQLDEQPSTSSGHDSKPSDSSPEDSRKSSPVESDIHSKDGDKDLLEVEVTSGAPAAEFDFDEVGDHYYHPLPSVLTLLKPSSPVSSAHREDEVLPLEASQAAAQLSSGAISVTYPPVTRVEEHSDTAESSHGITRFKKWIQLRTK